MRGSRGSGQPSVKRRQVIPVRNKSQRELKRGAYSIGDLNPIDLSMKNLRPLAGGLTFEDEE